ncbi:MAG: enoyl-CoA hydratase/isomerase family protein [Deltaproteobacteria bacterium]|nr:enoyl-CoA hydratase/isomerase family protein [Deltaproteobacteria bacterium]
MTGQPELLVQREGDICTLVINRPEKRNFLVPGFLLKMADVIAALSKEGSVRVLVIRGAGDEVFSAGYDISALPITPSPDMEVSLKETPPLEKALLSIRDFPYPVIAMLNGHAFGGGCELAIACDIRIAAKRTKMGMPPARLGLVYPYQGYRRFLTVLGFARTLEIFLTGHSYDSQSCLSMGLVNHVVDDADIEPLTYELAGDLVKNSPLSLRGTKSARYKIAEYPVLKRDDENALRELFIQSLQSEDIEEGKRAFMEKRTPRFKGR